MKRKKSKKKLKKNITFFLYIIFLGILFFFFSSLYLYFNIKDVTYNKDEDVVVITYSYKNNTDVYCTLSLNSEEANENDEWIEGIDNKCEMDVKLNNTYYLYVKSNDSIISNNKLNKNLYLELTNYNEDEYIASNGSYELKYNYLNIGNINPIKYSEYDKKIINIEENTIKSVSQGETILKIKYNDTTNSMNITVTDLITSAPNSFDFKKSFLGCNTYTESENDLLDLILKSRISEATYSTRAAAVEVARFLTLEFPYRINYFYENGRIADRTTKVDGEGRYYHIGLYLSEDRTSNIEFPSRGPAAWGCSIYNAPAKRDMANGLDCSGFVSWVLLNAGFDPGDIGAGITDNYDLTNTGDRKSLTYSLANSSSIKAGDLLWKNAGGGHIAIIVGIDSTNYYVAEALWDDYPETGVIINTYPKSSINKSYSYVILMDSFYKNDGNYSELWY